MLLTNKLANAIENITSLAQVGMKATATRPADSESYSQCPPVWDGQAELA